MNNAFNPLKLKGFVVATRLTADVRNSRRRPQKIDNSDRETFRNISASLPNIFCLQVALHPEWTIVACVLLTLLSCLGIINFSPKSDTLSLWIPETSVSFIIM